MRIRDRWNAGRVIRVPVRQEHRPQRRPVAGQRTLERDKMIRPADTGVHEHGGAVRGEQIRPVAGPGHRAWIARVEDDRANHVYTS